MDPRQMTAPFSTSNDDTKHNMSVNGSTFICYNLKPVG